MKHKTNLIIGGTLILVISFGVGLFASSLFRRDNQEGDWESFYVPLGTFPSEKPLTKEEKAARVRSSIENLKRIGRVKEANLLRVKYFEIL